MANILIISALQIFPVVSGGQHRTATIARELADAGHQVRIFSLIGRKHDMLRLTRSSETVVGTNLCEFVHRPFVLWTKAMLAYKRGIPPLWARTAMSQPHPKLSQWILEAEIIIYDFPYTFSNLSSNHKLRILNSHNVEQRLFLDAHGSESALTDVVRQLEHSAIASVDLVACASTEEMITFSSIFPDKEFVYVPNCIQQKPSLLDKRQKNRQMRIELGLNDKERILLFPASRYGPNIEGMNFLRRFSSENNEFLQNEHMVILVAGSVATTPERLGQFLTTGPVPAIEPYFYMADWGINPIFYGSGTSIKVAEFIAYDLPILTTEVGSRGFNFEDNRTAIFFTSDNLLDKLKALPEDPQQILIMHQGARFANAHFLDPTAAVMPLLSAISAWKPSS